MDVFKWGFRYWKKYLIPAIICQIMGFIAIGIGLLVPQLSQLIIDNVINYNPDAVVNNNNLFSFLLNGKYGITGDYSLFYTLALTFMGLILLRVALIYFRNVWFMKNGLNMEGDLRHDTYKKLVTQSNVALSKYNTGDLLNLLHSDIINFKEFYSRTILCILDTFYCLTLSFFFLGSFNLYLMIIPAIIIIPLMIALKRFLKRAKEISLLIRDSNSKMNLVVNENINAVRLVKSYANEDLEKQKFESANNKIKETYFKHTDIVSNFSLAFNIIRQVAYIGSIAVGGILLIKNVISVGSMVAFVGYVLTIMDNVTFLNNLFFTAEQQLVSGGKIMNFLSTENLIENNENHFPILENPNIETKNLSVIMDDQTILKDINISIPYGKSLGIMGGTGSGKTVLLKTLNRFTEATSGDVLINGKSIKDYELEDVRRQFSFVFQDVFLFSNTVDSNIAFYDLNTPEDIVIKVAKQARADDFITRMPQSYSTIIGEKGLGLSGGQKQRLSITRALLKNAPVVILDDATSALDMETEKAILSCLKQEYGSHSLIISAHRASSVASCDEIIYLQDGEIIERGTFDELMALNGRYASIYKKQSPDYDDVDDTEEENHG